MTAAILRRGALRATIRHELLPRLALTQAQWRRSQSSASYNHFVESSETFLCPSRLSLRIDCDVSNKILLQSRLSLNQNQRLHNCSPTQSLSSSPSKTTSPLPASLHNALQVFWPPILRHSRPQLFSSCVPEAPLLLGRPTWTNLAWAHTR